MINRRALFTGGAIAAGSAAISGCGLFDSGNSNTGTNVTQDAGSVNDLVVQQGELSIQAWNQVKADPSQAYPVSELRSSLELHQQRERLLRFNVKEKTGFAYLMLPGVGVMAKFPVLGKISSTQSSMTTAVGVYSNGGTGGGGNLTVELPGDDLSFGPNEGGPDGKFFYTPDGVYVYWDGPILYVDTAMELLDKQLPLTYQDGSKPSSTASNSSLFGK